MIIISDLEFAEKIPKSIDHEKIWVVGLSGGADSLCLTMLANNLAKQKGIKLWAVIVDHKLRSESSSEILPIVDILERNGIEHKILVWNHSGDISKNIEKKARDARYQLLKNFCKEIGAKVLMTAHHAFDQWETFFMRLSHGSSMKGLASIQSLSMLNDIFLIRPFLDFDPINLKNTLLKRFGIKHCIQDPSNQDLKFERARWRASYNELSGKYGLSIDSVNKSISRIQIANDCLNEIVKKIIDDVFDGSYINIGKFRDLPTELRIRVLDLIIKRFLSKDKIISYELLQRVSNEISQEVFVGSSLGGVVLKKNRTKNIKISI
ncbi:MAG: tRNA lysidine(34) synthetase TilS, partial [Holosporales bacterium]|nr:tRNA lysidine(34) synthetase TilS [Holosporales bacterium]